MMKFLKSWALLLTGLAIGVALTYILPWSRNDFQGDENASCEKFDGPIVGSGKGMEVSSHTTACTTLGTSVVNYVYIHPIDQKSSSENLVFRYSQSSSGNSLKVDWIDERHVVLAVDGVSQISKIQTTSGETLITYKIDGG